MGLLGDGRLLFSSRITVGFKPLMLYSKNNENKQRNRQMAITEENYNLYRFKTEEEFNKEYGPRWRSSIHWNPDGDMDHLLGKPLIAFNPQQISSTRYILEVTGSWSISTSMLKLIKAEDSRFPTMDTLHLFRFKTFEEFVKEFGDTWRDRVSSGWVAEDMDSFIGKNLGEFSDVSLSETAGQMTIERWHVSPDMYTRATTYSTSKVEKVTVPKTVLTITKAEKLQSTSDDFMEGYKDYSEILK